MIKANIAQNMSKSLGIHGREATDAVDAIMESFKDTIIQHGRLEIRDLGVFKLKTRKVRIGRNPKTKEEYPIPKRTVVTFRAGKNLMPEHQVE